VLRLGAGYHVVFRPEIKANMTSVDVTDPRTLVCHVLRLGAGYHVVFRPEIKANMTSVDVTDPRTPQIKDKIHNHTQTAALQRPPIWEDPVHGIILTLGNPQNLYKLLYTYTHFIFYILTTHRF
jgi:hypothetical protein